MKFQRGDTFLFSGPVSAKVNGVVTTDLTGWTARSQIRSAGGALIAELDVQWLSYSPAALSLECLDPTTAWPLGAAKIDVEFTTDTGKIVSTPAQSFEIALDVTRNE